MNFESENYYTLPITEPVARCVGDNQTSYRTPRWEIQNRNGTRAIWYYFNTGSVTPKMVMQFRNDEEFGEFLTAINGHVEFESSIKEQKPLVRNAEI